MTEPDGELRTERDYGARYWEGWLGVTEVDNPSVRERSAVCDARTIRSTWLI